MYTASSPDGTNTCGVDGPGAGSNEDDEEEEEEDKYEDEDEDEDEDEGIEENEAGEQRRRAACRRRLAGTSEASMAPHSETMRLWSDFPLPEARQRLAGREYKPDSTGK